MDGARCAGESTSARRCEAQTGGKRDVPVAACKLIERAAADGTEHRLAARLLLTAAAAQARHAAACSRRSGEGPSRAGLRAASVSAATTAILHVATIIAVDMGGRPPRGGSCGKRHPSVLHLPL